MQNLILITEHLVIKTAELLMIQLRFDRFSLKLSIF